KQCVMCGNVQSEYKIGRFVKIVQEQQKNRREDIQAPSFFSSAELGQEYIKQIQTTNPLQIDLCAQQLKDISTFLSSIRGQNSPDDKQKTVIYDAVQYTLELLLVMVETEKLGYAREQIGNYELLSFIGQDKEELEQRCIAQTKKWINTYDQLEQPRFIRLNLSLYDITMKESYE
ncbi:MAG: hypothetical protein EZS28_045170, partial [Streblomastix strix]